MTNDAKMQLEALIHTTQCDKAFACLRPGDDPVCPTRSVGMKHNVLCLEEQAHHGCRYLVLTALGRFCHCPVRVHLETQRAN